MPTRQEIADALAKAARLQAFQGKLDDTDVHHIDELAGSLFSHFPQASAVVAPVHSGMLTARGALELVGHEAIVLEWYKDSEGIGTWGIGVTNTSGHNVDQYKDKPSTIAHVLEIYLWLLRKRYIPEVVAALSGIELSEAQFTAALSFHYNTGAIGKTAWVGLFRSGQLKAARGFWESHYLDGGVLSGRRKDEAALFFDGTWTNNGYATVWPVKKPAYTPDWAHPQRVDLRADMAKAIAA